MANIFEQMSRSVSGMSKNASEASNLRKKIAYERERIQEVMQEIGELYYESQEKELAKLKELCADIDDRKRRIQSMRLELQQMHTCRLLMAIFRFTVSAIPSMVKNMLLLSWAMLQTEIRFSVGYILNA